MLELRPSCEICDRDLPAASTEAVICAFECTFCARCASDVLHDVCPNCGGGFSPRPVRPRDALVKHPPSTKRVVKPVNQARHAELLAKYRDVPPEQR